MGGLVAKDGRTTDGTKVDEGTRAIIELAATRAATLAVEKHAQTCSVADLKDDMWGPGGVKETQQAHKFKLEAIEKKQTFLRNTVQPVLSGLLLALILWLFTLGRGNTADASSGTKDKNPQVGVKAK